MFTPLKHSSLWKEWFHPSDGSLRRKRCLIADAHEGDRITFGVVPVAELSHKTVTLGAPLIYHFESMHLEVYPLLDAHDHTICNMILAYSKQHVPYLALSCPIPTLHQSDLCTSEDYAALCRGEYPRYLYVREHTARMRDWLFMRYECKISDVQGMCVRPDRDVAAFRYALYHAPEEHKALEIERAPSGLFTIYATLFLPASVVVDVETRHSAKAQQRTMPIMPLEPQVPQHISAIEQAQEEQHAAVSECEIIPHPRASAIASAVVPLPHTRATTESSEPLRCNLRMASKLIDEALRADLPVSHVIRKVLGLGVAGYDHMAFDIHLTDHDFQNLAARFNLPITEKNEILSRVMGELEDFTGESLRDHA